MRRNLIITALALAFTGLLVFIIIYGAKHPAHPANQPGSVKDAQNNNGTNANSPLTSEQALSVTQAVKGAHDLMKLDPSWATQAGGVPCGDYFFLMKFGEDIKLGYRYDSDNVAVTGLYDLKKFVTVIDDRLSKPAVEQVAADQIAIRVSRKTYETQTFGDKSTKCLPPPYPFPLKKE